MSSVSLDKLTGALLGTFVGDALGMPVEGWPAELIARSYGEVRAMLPARLGPGTYTDDTEMMIGVAESLLNCGGFNGADMARTFINNLNPHRGYGPGAIRVLDMIKLGMSWETASGMTFPGGSYGNGAPMRIAPVACLYYGQPGELRRMATESAHITHAHHLAKEGAALQARAIALALTSDPAKTLDSIKFLNQLKVFLAPEAAEYHHKLEQVARLLHDDLSRHDDIIRELGNGVAAINSVCTAIYAFLSRSSSFEEAVVLAVGLGGDTDTIGAMAGAISGAYHGQQGIPKRWLNQLEDGEKGKTYVMTLAQRLFDLIETP